MATKFLFYFLFLWCVPLIVFASSCSPDSATVVYINGIETTQKEASDDMALLRKDFLQYRGSPNITFLNGYNPSHLGGLGDAIESISQAINSPISNYDLFTIIAQLASQVLTRKVLLVGHSQGGFYANEIYDYLVKSGTPANSIGVYELATPADHVAGNGSYLTSSNDTVINFVRGSQADLRLPQALPANVTILEQASDASNTWSGHIPSVYLNGAAARIAADIKRALGALSADGAGSDSCIAAPQLGSIYALQKSAFAVADPLASNIDAAIRSTATAISEANTIGNDVIHTAFSDAFFAVIPRPTAQNAAGVFAVEKALYGSSLSVADYEALIAGKEIPENIDPPPTPQSKTVQPATPIASPIQAQQQNNQNENPAPATQLPQSQTQSILPIPVPVPITVSPGFGGGAPAPMRTVQSQGSWTAPTAEDSGPPTSTTSQPSAATTTLPFAVTSPLDQSMFSTSTIAFTGTTTPLATISASFGTTTVSTRADADGSWSMLLELLAGTTTVSFGAADTAGDTTATTTRSIVVALAQSTTTMTVATTTATSTTVATNEPAIDNPCGQSPLATSGYFFSGVKDDPEYPSGLLEYHFRINSAYADGRAFKITWQYFDDQCEQSAPENSSTLQVQLPTGVTDWSVRFSSPTHFEIWDDQHNAIALDENGSPIEEDIPALSSYESIKISGTIGGSASTLDSRVVKINGAGEPPSFPDTAIIRSGCTSGYASGVLFDPAYQKSEYVGRLLRIHLRLRSPYNSGPSFPLQVVALGSDCGTPVPDAPTSTVVVSLPVYIRYYSYRMVTPTHWVLWDDENDIEACAGCEGDIPADTIYVGFSATAELRGDNQMWTPSLYPSL
ncbi:MAG: hypothetical protein P4L81_01370 [Candidatus Pacebacteria bacterium]|nr:hypothetical protein [Candidatus Paceibacterota bacterium]